MSRCSQAHYSPRFLAQSKQIQLVLQVLISYNGTARSSVCVVNNLAKVLRTEIVTIVVRLVPSTLVDVDDQLLCVDGGLVANS